MNDGLPPPPSRLTPSPGRRFLIRALRALINFAIFYALSFTIFTYITTTRYLSSLWAVITVAIVFAVFSGINGLIRDRKKR